MSSQLLLPCYLLTQDFWPRFPLTFFGTPKVNSDTNFKVVLGTISGTLPYALTCSLIWHKFYVRKQNNLFSLFQKGKKCVDQ